MFDNFVVQDNKKEDEQPEPVETSIEEEEASEQPVVAEPEEKNDTIEPETQPEEEIQTVPEDQEKAEAPKEELIPSYSQDELDAAVQEAKEQSYAEGLKAAEAEEIKKQNILLEEVKNQLTVIFAGLDEAKNKMEESALAFALAALRKALPTLEKERAEAEVKNFLGSNFPLFAAQDSLSFAFNPETVKLIAGSLERLAEQNDFEGKIAVHKDASLGAADCRVEWKNGGVLKKASAVLDKADELINMNQQERENG